MVCAGKYCEPPFLPCFAHRASASLVQKLVPKSNLQSSGQELLSNFESGNVFSNSKLRQFSDLKSVTTLKKSMPQHIYNPITAMGFSAMSTF